MRKKGRVGEYIELGWDGEAGFHALRGHIPIEEAKPALIRGLESLGEDWDPDSYLEPVHAWARWCRNGSGLEYDSLLRVYHNRKAGRFPVTVMMSAGSGGLRDSGG